MAEYFVEEIYKISKIIDELYEICDNIQLFYDKQAVNGLNNIWGKLGNVCQLCLKDNLELGKILWEHVKKMTEINEDLLSIENEINSYIIPLLLQWVSSLADINTELDDSFLIKSTKSGFLTLYDYKKKLYIHGTNNPMEDARKFVKSLYEPQYRHYNLFGCGLGYIAYQLYLISGGYTKIRIYESNKNMVDYAQKYGVLEWIPKECLEVISEYDINEVLSTDSDTGFMAYVPFIHLLDDGEEKNKILTKWIEINTLRNMNGWQRENRLRNNKKIDRTVEEYLSDIEKKDVIVVAAGPSLDDNLGFLKENMNKLHIIAVGTVYRKLMDINIIPNCVVMIDPWEKVYEQIKGLEQMSIPLIVDENVYWKVADQYKGKTYIISNSRLNNQNWSSGGTVSYTAIELGCRICKEKIFLVGLDLGYPNRMSHALGSADSKNISVEGMIPVNSVSGEIIYTDKHMTYYRENIENLIAKKTTVQFINKSQIGVRIKGTIEG